MLKKQQVLGVGITSEKTSTILENVIAQLHHGTKKLFIVTPNPEILVYANDHLAYRDKLNTADVALADGVGVLFASRLLGLTIQERTTGVDFIEKLCETSCEKPLSMGFLGGRGNVAELTAKCLQKKYPWIDVVFTGEEWNEDGIPLQIDILFVAYGFPKQEEWIYDNVNTLPVRAAMGVGGAFDYISGKVPRAPKLVRSSGLEWLFRLMVQPWRLKRQVALLEFAALVIKELPKRFTYKRI